MALRTREDYIAALSKMNDNIYCNGKKVSRLDPMFEGCINVLAKTYELAQEPEYADLMLAKSHLTGETINRFNHIHQSTEDLHKKQDVTCLACSKIGTCCRRCMGIDAANAINAVSYEAQKLPTAKTTYYDNFLKWLEYFQKNDLIASCAQTDLKGDRMLRPSQQPDPDQYVHIDEETAEGIYVSGCKVHISEAIASDEILVLPCRSLVAGEEKWAVSFAVKSDDPGVKQIVALREIPKRESYKKGFEPGYSDSYIVFDHTFIPWERVFLCGELELGGILALLFALFHRHSYSGCKPATLDFTIGLASLAAEINGIKKAKHVKKILSDMICVGQLGYAAGYTASDLGKPEISVGGKTRPFGPGSYIPNVVFANVGRCLSGENVWHEVEMLCDIAGGFPSTFPYEADITSPETRDILLKYLKRTDTMSVEDQIKFWMQFKDYAISAAAAPTFYGQFHGGGSPIMEQIAITSQYDIKRCEDVVRELAGMSPRVKKEDKK